MLLKIHGLKVKFLQTKKFNLNHFSNNLSYGGTRSENKTKLTRRI